MAASFHSKRRSPLIQAASFQPSKSIMTVYTRKKAQCAGLEELMRWLFAHLSNDNTPTRKDRSPACVTPTSSTHFSTIPERTSSSDLELKHIHLQEVALPLAIFSLELALLEIRAGLGIDDTWHGSLDVCEDCASGTVTGARWWLELRKSNCDAEMAQNWCGDEGEKV